MATNEAVIAFDSNFFIIVHQEIRYFHTRVDSFILERSGAVLAALRRAMKIWGSTPMKTNVAEPTTNVLKLLPAANASWGSATTLHSPGKKRCQIFLQT